MIFGDYCAPKLVKTEEPAKTNEITPVETTKGGKRQKYKRVNKSKKNKTSKSNKSKRSNK